MFDIGLIGRVKDLKNFILYIKQEKMVTIKLIYNYMCGVNTPDLWQETGK